MLGRLTATAATILRQPVATRGFRATGVARGVTVTTVKEGDGKTSPKAGDILYMHYTGTLADGTKFDSSYDRGQPFVFSIGTGQVIRGWDEGILEMTKGEIAELDMTSDFAYGESGAGGVIPPGADLKFKVELLDIIKTEA